MIRVAHIADTHINETRRPEDTARVLAAFCEQAAERRVDLILHAGDFFDRKSTPAERNILADVLTNAAAIAPVIGVRGNHDLDGDLDLFGKLKTKRRVHLLTTAGVWASAAGCAVYGLPWFSKTYLMAQTEAGDESRATERAQQAVDHLLATVRSQAMEHRRAGQVPILLGHVLVAGSETSTGQTLIGHTLELSPGALHDTYCEYVALGHIHKRQDWLDGRVCYAGSTERMNYGEVEHKGWNLVTFDDAGLHASTEFVQLPARLIELHEYDYTESYPTLRAPSPGALVRVRYRIRPEDLHTVSENGIECWMHERGAVEVVCEAVLVHEDRIRSAEIASAESTWERVRSFWAAKGIEVPEAQQERVRAKLAEIEAGAPAAEVAA